MSPKAALVSQLEVRRQGKGWGRQAERYHEGGKEGGRV